MSVHQNIELVATGVDFVGDGVRSAAGILKDLIEGAEQSIWIAAYRFDPESADLLDHLEMKATQNIEVVIIVNSLKNQHRDIIRRVKDLGEKVKVIDYSQHRRFEHELMHAKVLVADSKRAFIGSSNFGVGGLRNNLEVNVLVEGKIAWELSSLLNKLANRCKI